MDKILIANRGEIAVRVIRTARELGYRTVAVYSQIDADDLHVSLADEAVCIGPASASESYLVSDNILSAAAATGADAVHPGYGFLSENADFASACADAGITFIGPSPDAIELMGSKRLSKIAMQAAGVPCVPGYEGADQSDDVFIVEAKNIGYPVMIKASAGGGGRGMRLVEAASELKEHLRAARSEAKNAFGSDELILEKAIIDPRHIEFQVFGDRHGNVVHLFERDCSIQRRHQKVIEEAPSPFMTEELRARMGAAAVDAAKSCNYVGAGTVEFLVDGNRNFYFLEMNTRLQVEHPVTEMVTGQDLVAWQLCVAEGKQLPLAQDEIELKGHAIEARLYAEDPRQGFLPQTGTAEIWKQSDHCGNHIRIDSGIASGQAISAHYDPMIAKIICWGSDRTTAARTLASALQDTQLLGVASNKLFLENILRSPAFLENDVTTAFIDKHFACDPSMQADKSNAKAVARAALVSFAGETVAPQGWGGVAGECAHFLFELNGNQVRAMLFRRGANYFIETDGSKIDIELVSMSESECLIVENGVRRSFAFVRGGETVFLDGDNGHLAIKNITFQPAATTGAVSDGRIKAPMDGAIIDVRIAVGESVKSGDVLVVMEAMKMEHSLKASADGVVTALSVSVGDQVKSRQIVAVVEAKPNQEEAQ